MRIYSLKITYTIQLLILLSSALGYSQNEINTRDFFPYIDSSYKELHQKIKITDQDTTEYVFHKYEYLAEDNRKYLISKTFDADMILRTVFKEEITSRGLRFVKGFIIEYDSLNNSNRYEIKGRHKITFPFKPIRKMSHWKINWKNTYDNKVIVRSKIEYLGRDSIVNNGEIVYVLNFKRTVKATFKKEYNKEKISYEYLWSFARGQGMFKYSRKGDQPLEGIIIENKLIK